MDPSKKSQSKKDRYYDLIDTFTGKWIGCVAADNESQAVNKASMKFLRPLEAMRAELRAREERAAE